MYQLRTNCFLLFLMIRNGKMIMNINISTNPNGDVVITVSPGLEEPAWATKLLETMKVLTSATNSEKDNSMALSKTVQDLVDQVAASKSLEASSAAAMTELVNQSAQLKKTVDDLMAAAAAAGTPGMTAEDAAAIAQAAADLAASATALQAAVPASTPPPATPVV